MTIKKSIEKDLEELEKREKKSMMCVETMKADLQSQIKTLDEICDIKKT